MICVIERLADLERRMKDAENSAPGDSQLNPLRIAVAAARADCARLEKRLEKLENISVSTEEDLG